MCGRMNISDHEGIQWLLEQLGLSLPEEKFTPKYNVSPTAALWGVGVVRQAITLEPMQWGFIPPWAKEGVFKKPLFNACLLYTSPSPRDGLLSRMPSSA